MVLKQYGSDRIYLNLSPDDFLKRYEKDVLYYQKEIQNLRNQIKAQQKIIKLQASMLPQIDELRNEAASCNDPCSDDMGGGAHRVKPPNTPQPCLSGQAEPTQRAKTVHHSRTLPQETS